MSSSPGPIDPQAHGDKRNWVETILRQVPGFRGYLEKEYRRDSDYLARKWLADRLDRSKRPLDDYLRQLVSQSQLHALPGLEQFRTRLDGFISRLRAAVRGYSGFFDYVRVDEGLLDRVYALDMGLIQEVDALAEEIERLPSGKSEPEQAARELQARLDSLENRYNQRAEMLQGLAQQ